MAFQFFKKSRANISLKIKSYVHQEHNKEKFTNIENIKNLRIYDKEDIFGRNLRNIYYKPIKIDDTL